MSIIRPIIFPTPGFPIFFSQRPKALLSSQAVPILIAFNTANTDLLALICTFALRQALHADSESVASQSIKYVVLNTHKDNCTPAIVKPLILPFPVENFRHIFTVLFDVGFVIEQLITQKLLAISSTRTQARHSVDNIPGQMKAVEVI